VLQLLSPWLIFIWVTSKAGEVQAFPAMTGEDSSPDCDMGYPDLWQPLYIDLHVRLYPTVSFLNCLLCCLLFVSILLLFPNSLNYSLTWLERKRGDNVLSSQCQPLSVNQQRESKVNRPKMQPRARGHTISIL